MGGGCGLGSRLGAPLESLGETRAKAGLRGGDQELRVGQEMNKPWLAELEVLEPVERRRSR